MSRPLLPDALAEVREKVRDAGWVSLFLDFDGTLTPIVDNPADAYLEPAVRAILETLSHRDDTLLIFISGRAVGDLQTRVGVSHAVYAGNHGLEIIGGGVARDVNFVEPSAVAKQDMLKRLVSRMAESLSYIPGAWVEDKALTASVHYRLVAPREERRVANIVHAELAHHSSLFQLQAGKKVFEIVPRTNWHKGAAVCWINARLARSDTASIYIGDDRTDEDAFAKLPDEITIRVGEPEGTGARYHVEGPAEVRTFLEWLDQNR